MRYNKSRIEIDSNGILRPKFNKSGWYDNGDYAYAILVLFENQKIEKLSFQLGGKYVVTIFSKDLVVKKEKRYRDDGTHYWLTEINFINNQGYLTEFLYLFIMDEKVWLDHPYIKFEEITQ
jgi:hypothetical protein